jgi:hypothetical protein
MVDGDRHNSDATFVSDVSPAQKVTLEMQKITGVPFGNAGKAWIMSTIS